MDIAKFTFVTLLFGFFALPMHAFSYDNCPSCISDHRGICIDECVDKGEECKQTCAEEKCKEFCDPDFARCAKCRGEKINVCFKKCEKASTPEEFKVRRACVSGCVEQQCEKECTKKDVSSAAKSKS